MATPRKIEIVCIILTITSGISYGLIGNRYWKFRQLVEDHQRSHAEAEIMARLYLTGQRVRQAETFFLEQPLDHFNAMSKVLGKTFRQRYYVNKENWQGGSSPVFLFIGGEGTLTPGRVEAGEIFELSKDHGALLVAAEHRFYGASLNNDGLQLEELQHLSSQQALADLATFIDHIKAKYHVPGDAKWVCFGGSYPGALSAWFRLKYPHLVFAAVASSAPVRAITNFEGYNEVVAASLSSDLVGGSSDCLDMVKKAFQTVDFKITTGQFKELESDFLSCGPIQEKMDIVTFVSNLAGYFMGVVQYNEEIPGQNISMICKAMLSTGDPYENLITVNKMFLDLSNEKCGDNSYANYTAMMMNTTVDLTAVGAGMRQWTYQTCSQFGYYQTCDANTSCPFSHLMTLANSDLQVCQQVFKIDPSDVDNNVQFSLDYYGGNHTQQTRIIFVNGSIDPWHWLSILRNQTSLGEYAVFIQGTAHCADLGTAKSTDPPSLTLARMQIAGLLNSFLKSDDHPEVKVRLQ